MDVRTVSDASTLLYPKYVEKPKKKYIVWPEHAQYAYTELITLNLCITAILCCYK